MSSIGILFLNGTRKLLLDAADLRLVAQMDEELGEMAVVLVCKKCRQREILAVR